MLVLNVSIVFLYVSKVLLDGFHTDQTVVSRMTVKIRYEQIEQMTWSPKLYNTGINFHEKVVCFDQPRTLPVVITTLSLCIIDK